jgi:hypothetical protein
MRGGKERRTVARRSAVAVVHHEERILLGVAKRERER